jgi:hypothetical protein
MPRCPAITCFPFTPVKPHTRLPFTRPRNRSGRGGCKSDRAEANFTWIPLENLFAADRPKVERLVPEWKRRVPGENVWFATPKRFADRGRMIAAIVEPDRAFGLVSVSDCRSLQAGGRAREGMWSFTLEPLGHGQTRRIARLRGGTPPDAPIASRREVCSGSRRTSSWSIRCSARSGTWLRIAGALVV